MSSPTKPWEKPLVNKMRTSVSASVIDHMSSQPLTTEIPGRSRTQNPPPVPARNYYSHSQGSEFATGYNGIGIAGSGYGTGYGGFGTAYSPFNSMYSGMYGGFGVNRYDSLNPSSFSHQAELSSRQAFQSIESIVRAVGSVAALLDSTFQAVYNSFRAVVGVADHMSRLKIHLTRIFSTLALLRALRWVTSWLLTMLRLQQPSSSDDHLWATAAEQVNEGGTIKLDVCGENHYSWPVIIFFAFIIVGPWLIWKFLSSFSKNTEVNAWASGAADHYVAVAEFDFSSQNADELSFEQGAMLTVAPKDMQPDIRGWLLACVSGQKTGMIPANYVRILGKCHGIQHSKCDHLKRQQQPAVSFSHWHKDFVMEPTINSDDNDNH